MEGIGSISSIGKGLMETYHIGDADLPSEEEMDQADKSCRLEVIACHQYQRPKDDAETSINDKDVDKSEEQLYNECPSHRYRNDGQSFKRGIDS